MSLPASAIFVLLKEVQVHQDLQGVQRKESILKERRVSAAIVKEFTVCGL
jgi:hypothetical protein